VNIGNDMIFFASIQKLKGSVYAHLSEKIFPLGVRFQIRRRNDR
jgi:hypothetical protein